jgi:hypothetical protein
VELYGTTAQAMEATDSTPVLHFSWEGMQAIAHQKAWYGTTNTTYADQTNSSNQAGRKHQIQGKVYWSGRTKRPRSLSQMMTFYNK